MLVSINYRLNSAKRSSTISPSPPERRELAKVELSPGKYTLRTQVRDGYYNTAPHTLSYTVNVTAGSSLTTAVFGEKAIAPA